MVTGASEGIGKEFALQLARKGFNVVVSARNAAALDALVAEIGQLPAVPCEGYGSANGRPTESSSPQGKKVQAKAFVMDFSRLEDERGWSAFAAALEGLDIGVLGAF